MLSIIAVTNKHTAKLHHVGSLYICNIICYEAGKYVATCVSILWVFCKPLKYESGSTHMPLIRWVLGAYVWA